MNAALFNKAQNSIAFNPAAADEINSEICKIDQRLYSFAYYSPVSLQNTSAHACFYLAVINMYSLIWDCGPMLNSLIYKTHHYNHCLPTCVVRDIQEWKILESVVKTISYIRSDTCHNNSKDYYFNKASQEAHHLYIASNLGRKITGTSQLSENQWETICENFLNACDSFSNTYRNILIRIESSSLKDRNDFTGVWLGYIEEWYKRNKDISINVLAELYPLAHSNKGKTPISADVRDIYCWIAKHQSQSFGNRVSNKDACHAYIKTILDNNIKTCLSSPDCPQPAWPKLVLQHLFKPTALNY